MKANGLLTLPFVIASAVAKAIGLNTPCEQVNQGDIATKKTLDDTDFFV